MEPTEIPDSLVADAIAGAVDQETIASLWSGFVTPQSMPGDTLKAPFAPGYSPPEIPPKIISFPGQDIPGADYTVLSQLGEGGMGIVFEARQSHLDRIIALKMVRAERAGDPLARNAFFYEAVITAGLEHPGIVPVLEFGRAQEGRDFYVMKKASGVPWSRVIRDKTLEENLAIFDRVADVISYAHSKGVLHRDLKPSNVLLGDHGEIWVSDWGVAVAVGPDGTYNHAHLGGTPQYMPPEMALGDNANLGPASDVYLLGAILFQIIAGIAPHPGADTLAALLNAAENTREGFDDDGGLTDVVGKALAASPTERYPTAPDLQAAVRESLIRKACDAHIDNAALIQAKAVDSGDYDLFRQALSEYDAALATHPGHPVAVAGRRETVAAYARTAFGNGEFDLALTLIEPEAAAWDKAAALTNTIKTAKTEAKRGQRRNQRLMLAAGGLVLALVAAASGLNIRSQKRLDRIAGQLAETRNQAEQDSQSGDVFENTRREAIRRGEIAGIQMRLPGGISHDLQEFRNSFDSQAQHQREELERIMNRLAILLKPIETACDNADVMTDEGITEIYRQLKSIRPMMQKEVENIDALVQLQALNPDDADTMRENLTYLINVPDEFNIPH